MNTNPWSPQEPGETPTRLAPGAELPHGDDAWLAARVAGAGAEAKRLAVLEQGPLNDQQVKAVVLNMLLDSRPDRGVPANEIKMALGEAAGGARRGAKLSTVAD